MILLIDNYDSFSYNLYQLIGTINPDIKVSLENDKAIKGLKDEIAELKQMIADMAKREHKIT